MCWKPCINRKWSKESDVTWLGKVKLNDLLGLHWGIIQGDLIANFFGKSEKHGWRAHEGYVARKKKKKTPRRW